VYPPEIPVTVPVLSIAATPEALLLHTPPEILSRTVMMVPAQRAAGPVMAPADTGNESMVIMARAEDEQLPKTMVYAMVSMPPTRPETVPAVTVAFVLAALHEPPEVVSMSVMVVPAQTEDGPEMIPGDATGLTVTTYLAKAGHIPRAYSTVSTPGVIPMTMPSVGPTEACEFVTLQEPPRAVSVRVIDASTHKADGPRIGPTVATGFTVTTAVAMPGPQPLLTL